MIKKEYDSVVFVNLIDKKKDQKILGDAFERVCKGRSDFVWFDFHAECKNMKYENLQKLLQTDEVSNGLKRINFTYAKLPSSFTFGSSCFDVNIISTQSGVFRVNCVDSLDRSNVVQSLIQREMTKKMISLISCNQFEEKLFPNPLEFEFKNIWADNGDQLAMSYSGTKALKGDYTRYGKKSIKGTLLDGVYSVKRYFINNFRDGYNQDALDYSLGNLSNFKTLKVQSHSLFYLYTLILSVVVLFYYSLKIVAPLTENASFLTCSIRYLIVILINLLVARFIFTKNKHLIIDKSTIKYDN